MIPRMGLNLDGVDLCTESLHSQRLLLRPWQLTDADEVHRACQDAEIQRWLTAVPSPYTLDDARRFVSELAWDERRAGSGMQCAAVERESGQLVASVGLMRLGGTIGPEIGYWVAPWGRGRGHAAEATDALARWAFEHGARRVSLLAAPSNVASCRTAERGGFRREGVLREAEPDRCGGHRDLAVYGRLANDPAPTGLAPR